MTRSPHSGTVFATQNVRKQKKTHKQTAPQKRAVQNNTCMKKILALLCLVLMSTCFIFAAKSSRETVVFNVDLHCQGCINKIEKNIAFEQGVKDIVCDLNTKTVTIVFDPQKTSVEKLQEAFRKINKPATVNQAATEKARQTKKK